MRVSRALMRRLWTSLVVAFLSSVAVPASAACMQGTFQDVEALSPDDRGTSFEVLVADEDVQASCNQGLSWPSVVRTCFCLLDRRRSAMRFAR